MESKILCDILSLAFNEIERCTDPLDNTSSFLDLPVVK